MSANKDHPTPVPLVKFRRDDMLSLETNEDVGGSLGDWADSWDLSWVSYEVSNRAVWSMRVYAGKGLAAISAYLTGCCILRTYSTATMNAVLYEKGGVDGLRVGTAAKPTVEEKQVRQWPMNNFTRVCCKICVRKDLGAHSFHISVFLIPLSPPLVLFMPHTQAEEILLGCCSYVPRTHVTTGCDPHPLHSAEPSRLAPAPWLVCSASWCLGNSRAGSLGRDRRNWTKLWTEIQVIIILPLHPVRPLKVGGIGDIFSLLWSHAVLGRGGFLCRLEND